MHTLQLDLLAEGLSLMLKAGAYFNQWLGLAIPPRDPACGVAVYFAMPPRPGLMLLLLVATSSPMHLNRTVS